MGGACGTYKMRNAYKIVVGIFEGKRPLRRSKYRWKDNIKIDLKEVMTVD
jgi:hypothetical protein